MALVTPKSKQGMSPSHDRARKQEKETAKRLGGRVTKASGATAYEKGDVRLKGVARIECKTTKNKSFSVTRKLIDKMEADCLGANETPILEVEFCDDRGNKEKSIYVIPAEYIDRFFSNV